MLFSALYAHREEPRKVGDVITGDLAISEEDTEDASRLARLQASSLLPFTSFFPFLSFRERFGIEIYVVRLFFLFPRLEEKKVKIYRAFPSILVFKLCQCSLEIRLKYDKYVRSMLILLFQYRTSLDKNSVRDNFNNSLISTLHWWSGTILRNAYINIYLYFIFYTFITFHNFVMHLWFFCYVILIEHTRQSLNTKMRDTLYICLHS